MRQLKLGFTGLTRHNGAINHTGQGMCASRKTRYSVTVGSEVSCEDFGYLSAFYSIRRLVANAINVTKTMPKTRV